MSRARGVGVLAIPSLCGTGHQSSRKEEAHYQLGYAKFPRGYRWSERPGEPPKEPRERARTGPTVVPSAVVRERRTLRTLGGRDHQSRGCALAHRNQHDIGPLCCGSPLKLGPLLPRAALFRGGSVIPKVCLPII